MSRVILVLFSLVEGPEGCIQISQTLPPRTARSGFPNLGPSRLETQRPQRACLWPDLLRKSLLPWSRGGQVQEGGACLQSGVIVCGAGWGLGAEEELLQYQGSENNPFWGSLAEVSLGEREGSSGGGETRSTLANLDSPLPRLLSGAIYSVTSQVTQGSLEGVVLWIVMCVPLPATLRVICVPLGMCVYTHPLPPGFFLSEIN